MSVNDFDTRKSDISAEVASVVAHYVKRKLYQVEEPKPQPREEQENLPEHRSSLLPAHETSGDTHPRGSGSGPDSHDTGGADGIGAATVPRAHDRSSNQDRGSSEDTASGKRPTKQSFRKPFSSAYFGDYSVQRMRRPGSVYHLPRVPEHEFEAEPVDPEAPINRGPRRLRARYQQLLLQNQSLEKDPYHLELELGDEALVNVKNADQKLKRGLTTNSMQDNTGLRSSMCMPKRNQTLLEDTSGENATSSRDKIESSIE